MHPGRRRRLCVCVYLISPDVVMPRFKLENRRPPHPLSLSLFSWKIELVPLSIRPQKEKHATDIRKWTTYYLAPLENLLFNRKMFDFLSLPVSF
jgi:hypothetical protein